MPDTPALEYARSQQDRFLDDLKQLLRIPSISALSEHLPDIRHAAQLVRDQLARAGLEAEVLPGEGPPLVYAEWLKAPGRPTVLVYGHYDVQPADPLELWQTPPFEPTIRDGNIFARGASDDKGQTVALIKAAEACLASTGKLPVNLKFLIEGEEESGGEAIERYVTEHGKRLTADFVQIADSHMFGPGAPMLETGLRGIVALEIHARGATHDLHSGLYGGVAPNPLIALSHVIAGLKDAVGTITIPGFYDDVVMPGKAILDSWGRLPFEEEEFRQTDVGCAALVGEEGFTPLERMWARPTLDVHGFVGGFTGEGTKTVIPGEAAVKISMRLVPNQDPVRILNLLRERVDKRTPRGIELEVRPNHASKPVVVPENSPFLNPAATALEETFGNAAVLGRSGGSIPVVGVFKEALGLDSLLMGFGLPDDNLHSPNEKMSLENFRLGIEATIRFWEILGDSTGA